MLRVASFLHFESTTEGPFQAGHGALSHKPSIRERLETLVCQITTIITIIAIIRKALCQVVFKRKRKKK